MDKSFIIKELIKNKSRLEHKFNITRIGLFGSYSKGTQTIDSDIDIIYELEEGTRLGLKEVYELEVFFKNLFEKENIDLVNKKYMNPIIGSEVDKSAIYV